ncbi:uncharacterized protein CTHT_0010890 [Thermochaetoides thermophila DSM 1495]|uniref:Uncharacterized protein n=1 Tax=Chaetomium thermophilum (strain DSM 1495 / CBS 144.50 / IMI 039719) TaxID=759272 RepID=G0S0Q7_CHATD|nr:hypothetical protein CTHT_0010890 [Thermochaetoides thermophila DSM 1495]EGS22617.1 hypothetical protein CTHT_0010890 [Thermochaetoides thermophila DSM 1495]
MTSSHTKNLPHYFLFRIPLFGTCFKDWNTQLDWDSTDDLLKDNGFGLDHSFGFCPMLLPPRPGPRPPPTPPPNPRPGPLPPRPPNPPPTPPPSPPRRSAAFGLMIAAY